MSLPRELARVLDNFTPLKRKALSDESNGKRFRKNSKGDALDLDAFYSRLSSYYPGIWSSFHPLSPLYAASWGWVCMGSDKKETLKCVSCTGSLITSLPKRSLPSVYYKAANILKIRISTSMEKGGGHEKFCPWLAAKCPDIFQEIDLASQLHQPSTILKEQFTKQWVIPFTEMFTLEKVPYIPLEFRPQHSPKIYEIIKERFPSLAYPERRFLESIFMLSLIGWSKKSNFIIQCKMCQRQCALWNFPSINEEVSLEKEKEEKNKLKEVLANEKLEKLQKGQNPDHSFITFDENLAKEAKSNIQNTEEVSSKRLLNNENPIEGSNKSNEEKANENLHKDEADEDIEDEGTEEDDVIENEEEEEEEVEDDYRDEESYDSISSDSDIIEIISSSEDELLREDSDPEKPFLHLDEESSNSSGDSEINNDDKVSSGDSPSRPNSTCEDEIEEQGGNKGESLNESQSQSNPEKIENSSEVSSKAGDENTLIPTKNSPSLSKKPSDRDDTLESSNIGNSLLEKDSKSIELSKETNCNSSTCIEEKEEASSNSKNDSCLSNAENIMSNSSCIDEKVKFFNPISQHQPWCSWIVNGPATQRTGYETILFILQNNLFEEKQNSSMGTSQNVQTKFKKMLSVLDSIVS